MEHSDKEPAKDEFAQLVIARLRETGLTGEISYDAEEFEISVAGEIRSTLYLGNAYQEYCSFSQEDRPHSLRRFVRGWLDAHKPTPDEYADVRPDILPAVRSRSFFESARLRMVISGDDDTFLQYQTIGDDLGLGLVYDMPDSMKPISNKEIELWGVTFYDALEAARENIRQLPPQIIGPKEGEGVYVFATNDGYDSSRLIILDLIRQFQVKGDYIAMVPGREMLIVAGSEDTPGLEAMVALTKKAFDQPRTVSGVALRLAGDEWVSWMPEAAHPLYDEFRGLRIRSYGQDYAEQKELLDQLHKTTGEDVFVASFSGFTAQGSDHFTSYCVWGRGVLAWLPRTDLIGIMAEHGQPPQMVPWDRAAEVLGDLMEAVDIYPPRFRVREFPTEKQLAAMGKLLN